MHAQLQNSLRNAAQALAITIDQEQFELLLEFLAQLQRWNKVYNLTAILDPKEMLIKHIVDCLAVLPELDKRAKALQKETIKIVDVGSGGGLPGVIIAIMRPTWEIYCVDAVEKKVSFIQQMRAVLNCSNLYGVHARIERLEAMDCDVLINRAFSSLKNILDWAGHHVAPMGYIVAMKGKTPSAELDEIQQKQGWLIGPVVLLDVPQLNEERCLVIMEKQG